MPVRPLGHRRDVRLRPCGRRGPGRGRSRGCHQPARPPRRQRRTADQRGVRVLLHDSGRRRKRDHPAGDHPRHVGLPGTSGPVGTWRSERPATAVDEILRWASPAVVLQRTAIEDTEVAGHLVRQGERVGLYFASANFDEEVFDDPRRFDIGRRPIPTSPSARVAPITAWGPTSPAWS